MRLRRRIGVVNGNNCIRVRGWSSECVVEGARWHTATVG